ncbi:MAG: DUF2065 domain-containing protein [Minwuiales bacterium]|nr:DUF2065 domain-containing protein [Minwuiales bacterium]
MTDLLVALGLVLAIEGCIYALFPSAMQRMMASLQEMPPETLRRGGLAAAVVGVFIVWLIRA